MNPTSAARPQLLHLFCPDLLHRLNLIERKPNGNHATRDRAFIRVHGHAGPAIGENLLAFSGLAGVKFFVRLRFLDWW
jgi:hypothetical protein